MAAKENGSPDLGEYLRRRLEYLGRCNADIENKLCDDEYDLCSNVDQGVLSREDPAVGTIIFHIECVAANTFRYTMLVGVCSFLEEAVKEIAKLVLKQRGLSYASELKSHRRENWLCTHIRLLRDRASLDVASFERDVDTFSDLITLRNCVVHAWGRLSRVRGEHEVRAAAERIKTAGVSKDGYLMFDDQVIPLAITTAEDIVDSILEQTLQISIT